MGSRKPLSDLDPSVIRPFVKLPKLTPEYVERVLGRFEAALVLGYDVKSLCYALLGSEEGQALYEDIQANRDEAWTPTGFTVSSTIRARACALRSSLNRRKQAEEKEE